VLDFPEFHCLPPNRAGNLGARRIKDLARLTAVSPQSYPQILWAAEKVFADHALAALF
jgi:hypothetical protein